MASIKDVERVADDLDTLVQELRSELQNGPDFEKLIQIADDISEHADNAAQTFSSVNDALMSRINEITGKGGRSQKGSGSSSQGREKAASSSSSSSSS
jgi:ABC-type transporter Mla subunit MlaD